MAELEARKLLAVHQQDTTVQDEFSLDLSLKYLSAFGYLAKQLSEVSKDDIVEGIKKFKQFFGIVNDAGEHTDTLDRQTMRLMMAPRCGHPDITTNPNLDFIKQELNVQEFAANNLNRWRKTGITYRIADYLSNLGKSTQDQAAAQAFQNWADICNLNVRVAGPNQTPDIIIRKGRGQGSQFDGPSGVLAWALLPDGSDNQLEIRFDQDETWVTVVRNQGDILYYNVLGHEGGHALGLTHSQVSSAFMAPYYSPQIATPQQNDDIPRMQTRYGPRTTPTVPTTPNIPTVPPLIPSANRKLILEIPPGVTLTLDGKEI